MSTAYARATVDNGLFDELCQRWQGEIDTLSDSSASLEDFPMMNYAQDIVDRKTIPNAGIYILLRDNEPLGFSHVNTADLPRTTGTTLRSLWTTFAPKFELQDIDISDSQDLISGQIESLVNLSQSDEMKAHHVKFQLSNIVDRGFYVMFTRLTYKERRGKIAVRGNWFHIDDVADLA